MKTAELLEIVARGEDPRHQFRADAANALALGSEMVALSNSGGGEIFIGVGDDGTILPLDAAGVRRMNQLIGSAADTQVQPPINAITENVPVADGVVIVVSVADGISKPHLDNSGAIWVKNGRDRRRVTEREEMQRMFEVAPLVYADETPIRGTSIADVDRDYFRSFYQSRFGEELDEQEVSPAQVLTDMRLVNDGHLTLTAVLLFARFPEDLAPAFRVEGAAYPGNDLHARSCFDSTNIVGKLKVQFEDALAFIMRHLFREQRGQGVNSLGELEIPRIALEELLANALIHRDYLISSPVRIIIFDDRIEIVSPGHLPNHLTLANMRSGNSIMRNPTLASFATKLLPYRGLGTGVPRAVREYPRLTLTTTGRATSSAPSSGGTPSGDVDEACLCPGSPISVNLLRWASCALRTAREPKEPRRRSLPYAGYLIVEATKRTNRPLRETGERIDVMELLLLAETVRETSRILSKRRLAAFIPGHFRWRGFHSGRVQPLRSSRASPARPGL